jgi:hypothetical protein
MSDSNPFFDEIQAVNAEVQAWYAGTAGPGALDHLMAHFSPQFSMILPNGATLDWPTLLEITGGAFIARYPSGAVVTYIERQSDGEHNRNVRRSTAVLEIDAHGNVQWRHLQETFCAE